MIVYMHCDNASRSTACGFKSSRSAAKFISGRMGELAAYSRKRMPDGSTQDIVSNQVLTDIENITSSVKGNVEATVVALQKAIDLYETCIGNTSACHIIEDVKIVS